MADFRLVLGDGMTSFVLEIADAMWMNHAIQVGDSSTAPIAGAGIPL
jgi:hypothetical protein